MSGALLSVEEAGEMLGVSRRRAAALIQSGVLPAERVGGRWIVHVSNVHEVARTMHRQAGRPLSQESAWQFIDLELGKGELTRAELDQRRRRLRARAEHHTFYVHPSQVESCIRLSNGVLSGRSAAMHHGAPVDEIGMTNLYVRASHFDVISNRPGTLQSDHGFNLVVHVVKDSAWPFCEQQRYANLWVTWLDLADQDDRAADTVLDRVVGGRLRD